MLKLLNRMVDLIHRNHEDKKSGSCSLQGVSTFLTTNRIGLAMNNNTLPYLSSTSKPLARKLILLALLCQESAKEKPKKPLNPAKEGK